MPTLESDSPRLASERQVPGAPAGVHRSVVLFGGMRGTPVFSMERFADAMRDELPTLGWQASLVRGRPFRLPGPRAVEFACFELSRHVLYPLAARRQRADAYHITDHSYGHLVRALPAERTVVTCHDLMPWLVPEIFSRRLGRMVGLPLWERSVRAMRHAAHVTCVSECTRRDVIDRIGIPPDRTSVVPMAASESFHPLPADERLAGRYPLGFEDDMCVVLHVGHGQPYKNVEQVIRVVARLREMKCNAILAKVGPVTDGQEDLAAELGVPLHRFRGLSDEALNSLYNAADVMLYPSRYEGFGLPAAEAMRAGLPLVISTAPALVEVTGGLVPALAADDVDGMAEAVRCLYDARDTREAATVPARRHAEAYTWRRTATALAALFDRVAG